MTDGSDLRPAIIALLEHPQNAGEMVEAAIVAELNRPLPMWNAGDVRVAVDRMVQAGILVVQTIRRRHRVVCLASIAIPDWADEWIAQLGTASDRRIAKESGIDINAVRQKRIDLRIPPFSRPAQPLPPVAPKKTAPPAGRTGRPRVAFDESLLGTMSDMALATKLGVSLNTVFSRRKELKIPPFGQTARRKSR